MTEIIDLYSEIGTVHMSCRTLEPVTERKLGRVPNLMDWYLLIAELKRRELRPMGLEVRHERSDDVNHV